MKMIFSVQNFNVCSQYLLDPHSMKFVKLVFILMTLLVLTGVWWGGTTEEEYRSYKKV